MTTQSATGARSPKRVFLGGVVPILYVLALASATTLALANKEDARPGWAPAAVDLTARADSHAVRKPTRRAHRPQGRSMQPILHRAAPSVRPVPLQIPALEPAVSRSSDRKPAVVANSASVFVVRITRVATPQTMQSAIDACTGPVEILWSNDRFRWGAHPDEIAEHDYCGGSEFSSLAKGQRVRVIGGTLSGRYVVNGYRRFARAGSPAQLLNGLGAIVLQTCVPDGVVLVGLDRTT